MTSTSDWTSTITAVGPADKESITNFKLLIVEADTSGKWRCTNDNGVLVSDGFSLNIYTYYDFFDCQLVEFLTDYLAKPAFESWGIHKMYGFCRNEKNTFWKAAVSLKKVQIGTSTECEWQ
ncbi:hypothetical protein V8E54_003171 [Elaphomyces granulatus]